MVREREREDGGGGGGGGLSAAQIPRQKRAEPYVKTADSPEIEQEIHSENETEVPEG